MYRSTVRQKAGEWSRRTRWQSSCTTMYSSWSTGAIASRRLKLSRPARLRAAPAAPEVLDPERRRCNAHACRVDLDPRRDRLCRGVAIEIDHALAHLVRRLIGRHRDAQQIAIEAGRVPVSLVEHAAPARGPRTGTAPPARRPAFQHLARLRPEALEGPIDPCRFAPAEVLDRGKRCARRCDNLHPKIRVHDARPGIAAAGSIARGMSAWGSSPVPSRLITKIRSARAPYKGSGRMYTYCYPGSIDPMDVPDLRTGSSGGSTRLSSCC